MQRVTLQRRRGAMLYILIDAELAGPSAIRQLSSDMTRFTFRVMIVEIQRHFFNSGFMVVAVTDLISVEPENLRDRFQLPIVGS